MKRNSLLICASSMALVLLAVPCFAVTIDFDGFIDSTHLTSQVGGVTFTNATVITAGVSLNEIDFPPHSGSNVVMDDGGAINIVFDSMQASVGGFFTYNTKLSFAIYDGSDALLASVTSQLSNNIGGTPNEFLGLATISGIKRVTVTGDPGGGSFTLDDLTFTPLSSVPEPSTLLLLGSGLLGLVGYGRRRMKK